MAFGFNQYGKPTPNSMNILFDSLSAGLGIFASFFTHAAFVSHALSDIITSVISGLLIPLCPVVKRMFSVKLETDQKTVPISEVQVMNEKENPVKTGL